jgi:starch synthase
MLARRLTPLSMPGKAEVTLLDGQLSSGVKLVLFDAPVLYDRPGIYSEGGLEYSDNAKRFGLLSHAAAALVRQRAQQGRTFDIVHLHDWPAALFPLALRGDTGPSVPTVLTIHDAARQGSFDVGEIDALGLSRDNEQDEVLLLGGRINVLKAGVLSADAITTVSPSYADELFAPDAVDPLSLSLRASGKPVVGISNGVDYSLANPATDSALVSRYDAEDPTNRRRCKAATLRELGFELELERPLVLVVGERGRSRGWELVRASLPALLRNDLHLVLSGCGSELAAELAAEPVPHGERIAIIDPDEPGMRRLHAAADFVLIADEHDPSGVRAMVAQRYGALPVAHAAGGLKDATVDCDAALSTGSGFLFERHDERSLLSALQRALAAYVAPGFPSLVRRVMRLDVGWDRAARRYLQIYRQTIAARA